MGMVAMLEGRYKAILENTNPDWDSRLLGTDE
jgi:hypothetical protein